MTYQSLMLIFHNAMEQIPTKSPGMATLADTFTFLIVGIGAIAASVEPRAFHFSLWIMIFCLAGADLGMGHVMKLANE
jgi:hypothetical protein